MLLKFLGLLVVYVWLTSSSSNAYNLSCPVTVHWNIRAESYCPGVSTDKYFCLYDVINNNYIEGCRGPSWDRKGSKQVIAGDFTRGECSKDRYQPFDFLTNGNSDCVFLKSLCSGEGEFISSNGSGYLDRTCRCDFSKGYSYAQNPKNLECHPSTEDCSCIRKNDSARDIEWPKAVGSGGEIVIVTSNDLSIKVILKKEVLDTRRDRRIGGILMVVACLVLLMLCSIILLFYDDEFTSKIESRVLHYIQSKIYQTDLNEATIVNETVNAKDLQEAGKNKQELNSDISGDEVDSNNLCLIPLKGTIPKEHQNFLRICHLIFGVANPLVRVAFDLEIAPDQLGKTLKQLFYMKIMPSYLKDRNGTYSSTSISSEQFDIEKMVDIMKRAKAFASVEQGESLKKLLHKKKYLVDSVNGKMKEDEFYRNWREIGEEMLKLHEVPTFLREIEGRNTLRSRMKQMCPFLLSEEALRKFVYFTEMIPSQIMLQIIKEHCMNKHAGISQFLENRKHFLFHQRKTQYFCCHCKDFETFSKIFSDDDWNQMYKYKPEDKVDCSCVDVKKCFKRFEVNPDFQFSITNPTLLILIILNTPSLLDDAMGNMFSSTSSLRTFLRKFRHEIYHEVEDFRENKCCQCKAFKSSDDKHKMTRDEWSELFVRSSKNKKSDCDEICCCRFSVKDNLHVKCMEQTLKRKIMSVAGPFKIFAKHQQNPLVDFFTCNEDFTVYINANTTLLKAASGQGFVSEFKDKLLLQNPKANDFDANFTTRWLSHNTKVEMASPGKKTDAMILIDNEVTPSAHKVSIPVYVNAMLWRRRYRHFECTSDENNFLRVWYLLIYLVRPALCKYFNQRINDNIAQLLQSLEENYQKIKVTKTKENIQTENGRWDNLDHPKEKEPQPFQLTSRQRKLYLYGGKEVTAFDLDLPLMILILELKRNDIDSLRDDYELFEKLKVIKYVRGRIINSCSGTLNTGEFEKYWNSLSKVVIYFKGEDARSILRDLQSRNLLNE